MINNFLEIEKKHKKLIDKALELLKLIEQDRVHNIMHITDVVNFTKEICINLPLEINFEVCLISAYWHDVGRIHIQKGHEEESCIILQKYMEELNYEKDFISQCINAIKYHGWDMHPKTTEGRIVQDADFLALLGENRWKECLKYNSSLDKIVSLLPECKNKLNFEYSKSLFDNQFFKIFNILYKNISK